MSFSYILTERQSEKMSGNVNNVYFSNFNEINK